MMATALRILLSTVVLACPLWCGIGVNAGEDAPVADGCCCCQPSTTPTGPAQRPPADETDETACQCFCGGAVFDKEAGLQLPLDDAGSFAGSTDAAMLAHGHLPRLVRLESACPRECAQPGRAVCLRTMRFLC